MTKLVLMIILASFCISCTSKKPYTDAMKLELKDMYTKDMNAQKYDLKKAGRKSYSDSMRVEFDKVSKDNLIIAKKYFKEYGFPGIKENGKETALNFWLIVQHGDHDVAFQKKVLNAMKRELKTQNVSSRNFAYLYDRVKKNENKPQLYGTQMVWDNKGVHSPYKLEAPETVNKRRAEMGLESIEDYLKSF
ncbi:DUF6624 domain-containing protein [Flavobacterium enshiense]|uniref:DUF6624 domain-containing protein n=1 Tax=Flavobacterium enshiense TaxID=1341165 RepID=UPI00345D4E34